MTEIARKRIAVLGGGIAGLVAAHRLVDKVQSGRQITVIENTPRLGGWMQSDKTDHESLFESGPRRIRPVGEAGRATLMLASSLGLEDEILPVTTQSPAAKNRFIYAGGQLHMLPSNFLALFKKQPLLGNQNLLPIGLRELHKPKGNSAQESVHAFFTRRTTKEVADMLVDPFCRGIFGGDARLLSMQACFPALCKWEEDYGSFMKGFYYAKDSVAEPVPDIVKTATIKRWASWTLQHGLESLPLALEKALQVYEVQILKGVKYSSVDIQPNSVKIVTENNETEFDHVVSAIPSFALSQLLSGEHKSLADSLRQIPWVTMGVVSLEYEGSVAPVEGFGVLVPSSERSVKSMGIIFESCACPEHDRPGLTSSRFTVMMGGWWFEDLFGNPDTVDTDDLVQEALHTMERALGITQEPFFVSCNILKDCIPQYMIGHRELLSSMYSYISDNNLPLTLVGSSYEGVGINDCVLNTQKAIDKF